MYAQVCLSEYFRGTDTLKGEITKWKMFLLPSKKGSTLKGKNLLPAGANSFLLVYTLFWKDPDEQGSKEEIKKVVSLVQNGRKTTKSILSP